MSFQLVLSHETFVQLINSAPLKLNQCSSDHKEQKICKCLAKRKCQTFDITNSADQRKCQAFVFLINSATLKINQCFRDHKVQSYVNI